MQPRMSRAGSVSPILVVTLWAMNASALGAAYVQLNPVKDGTILDGGTFHPFDGIGDEADWYFNDDPSSYEGAITLATAFTQLEHRLVWEYRLATVTFTPPVTARLRFALRGAAAFPRPDVDVHVYNYPADLVESLSDFSAAPAVFQDHVIVAPYQDSTIFVIDVSHAVSQALADGGAGVAFRFQVDPLTSHSVNQAFMDALESEPDTKPVLTVVNTVPADANGSGLVDLDDYDWFEFCLSGPGSPAPNDPECDPLLVNFNDSAGDNDLDLRDFAAFQNFFGLQR